MERELGRLSGVEKVRADHKTQIVSFTLDTEQITPDEVKKQLELAGFRAG